MTRLLVLILLIPFASLSQNTLSFNIGGEFEHKFCDTLSFEYVRDKIIVPITINNKVRKFVFDTGAPLAISDELRNEIEAEALYSKKAVDALGKVNDFEIVKVKEFKLGNAIFKNVTAVKLDIINKGVFKCLGVEGILGSNAVRNCIVKIDVRAKKIIISNDTNRLSIVNTNHLPLKFKDDQSSPYVELSINDDIKFDVLFDSGSNDIVSIEKTYIDNAIEKGLAKLLNTGFGQTAVSVSEENNDESFSRVLLNHINIGKVKVEDIAFVSQDEASESSLGMGVAIHGVITIDYINKKFSFEPYKSLNKNKLSTIGFNIIPTKNNYVVGIVWSNTDAERLGLKKGYKVLKIEDKDFSTKSFQNDCSLLFENYTDREKLTITYEDDHNQVKTITLNRK
jgi:hypothetical protein